MAKKGLLANCKAFVVADDDDIALNVVVVVVVDAKVVVFWEKLPTELPLLSYARPASLATMYSRTLFRVVNIIVVVVIVVVVGGVTLPGKTSAKT